MKSAELVDYISGALSEGKSFRGVTFELINAGWDNVDIQESFALIQKSRSVSAERAHPVIEKQKPLTPLRGPVSNPLPSLVEESRPMKLHRKNTQGEISASRVFTSFLKKEMEKQVIGHEEKIPELSDVPLREIMSSDPSKKTEEIVKKEEILPPDTLSLEPLIPPPPLQETQFFAEVPDKVFIPKESPVENVVEPPQEVLIPVIEEKRVFEPGVQRPDGYFIPTLGYLADETAVGKQDLQTLAAQIGKPTFVIPTKVIITLWKRGDSA
jgi:hypothetical protein